MRRKCKFMVVFTDGAPAQFMESYCIDREEALSQVKEIFYNEILDIFLFQHLE